MNYKYTLSLIDKWTTPVKSIKSGMGGFGASLDKSRAQIKSYKKSLGDIAKFDAMKSKSVELSKSLAKQRDTVAGLRKQLEATKTPADALIKRFSAQSNKLADLEYKYTSYRGSIGKTIKSLKAQGVNTKDLAGEQSRLTSAFDKSTAKFNQQSKATDNLNSKINRLKTSSDKLKGFGAKMGKVAKWGAGIGAAGAAAGGGLLAKFAGTAGDFEDKFATLKTLEGGDGSKAEKSFDWVKTFAKTTPYQLGQVTDSFVKLRAYGIDPIKSDTLRVLGDTAAGMGKDVMDSVEAIADAVNGENERLKEFGIKASKIKGKGGKPAMIEYSFTNKDGKQELKRVRADSNKMIQETILGIWNSKYSGAMVERSKTWNGMLSNMGDTWTNFQNDVMQAGALDFLKGKLKGGLEWVALKESTGDLKKWAQMGSDMLVDFSKNAWAAGQTIWEVGGKIYATANKVAEFVGGWDKLLIGMAAFAVAGSVLGTVAAIASGITALAGAVALLASPLILVGVGIAAGVAAGWYLYNNWESVVDKTTALWNEWVPDFDFSLFDEGVAAGQRLADWWDSWSIDWPQLPDWSWPKIEAFSLSDWFTDWNWPALPVWTWPVIGAISLLDYLFDFDWPQLPDWSWPKIEAFTLPDFPDLSGWLPEMPDVSGWFSGLFSGAGAGAGAEGPTGKKGRAAPAGAVPKMENFSLPDLPKWEWPAIPPLPELPTFPIPAPIQFAFDLLPLNTAIGRSGAFKAAWQETSTFVAVMFPGLHTTISNALTTAPVDAFTASGLTVQERWGMVTSWAGTNFPALAGWVQTGLNTTPVQNMINIGDTLKAAWGSVINWFAEKFTWLMGMIDKARAGIASVGSLGGVGDAATGIMDTVSGWWGDEDPQPAAITTPAPLQPAETIPQKIAAAQAGVNVKSSSEIKLKIESAAPVKVQSMRAGKGTNLDVDTGRMMLSP